MALFEPHKYEKCIDCGSSKEKWSSCRHCAYVERMKGVTCPTCESSNVNEQSVTENNGIIGPGYSSHSVLDFVVCFDCGTMFKNLKEILKGEELEAWKRRQKINNVLKEDK